MTIQFALRRGSVRPGWAPAALLALVLAWGSPALALDTKDLIGLWKPLDASSPKGKAQGGIMFRADATGTFFDAPWDAGKNSDILKLLLPENANLSNLGFSFSYTVENELITTRITRAGGITVQSNPVHWKATLKDETLRMETTDGDARWIEFGLVARPN